MEAQTFVPKFSAFPKVEPTGSFFLSLCFFTHALEKVAASSVSGESPGTGKTDLYIWDIVQSRTIVMT